MRPRPVQMPLLPAAGRLPERIVSGGQTGVDRAALDVALEQRFACGGWCPKGRKAEDGMIPDRFPLTETPSDGYEQRTQWNVRDSDGTLVLTEGAPTGGTALTVEVTQSLGRPVFLIDLNQRPHPDAVRDWLKLAGIRVLNVTGPRESQAPGIYRRARDFLEILLDIGSAPCT